MKLETGRYSLRIIPEVSVYPDRNEIETAYIEEVLGLKEDGDSIQLTRKNAQGLSCIAYLETVKGG